MTSQPQVVYVQGPQMQPYVQQGGPPGHVQVVPQTTAVPANQTPGGDRQKFAKDSQKRCGIIQIVCGILALMIGIIMIPLQAGQGLSYVGTGIWCAPFMIIAGSFGVWSYTRQTNGPIVSCMVMSILASCFAFVFFCMSATACGIDNTYWRWRWDYDGTNHARLAMGAFGIIVGLTEIVVSIIQSAICCRTACCGAPQQARTVVYIPQPFPAQYALQNQGVVHATAIPAAGGQVTVISPAGAPVYPAVGGYPQAGALYPGTAQPGPGGYAQMGQAGVGQPGQAPGPVSPPQYSTQGPAPPAYAEKPPATNPNM